jgi:hypothetical protein
LIFLPRSCSSDGQISFCRAVTAAYDKSFAMQDGIFTLRGRAAWARDFNTDRIVGATFQALPGASFVVSGAAQAHDAGPRHRLRRNEVAEWLVRGHLRGRVLQRHYQLRWKGRGAILLVTWVSSLPAARPRQVNRVRFLPRVRLSVRYRLRLRGIGENRDGGLVASTRHRADLFSNLQPSILQTSSLTGRVVHD